MMDARKQSPRPCLTLEVLSGTYGIAKLAPDAESPDWSRGSAFLAFTRTEDEVSVVGEERLIPRGVRSQKGWRMLRVAGTLGFAVTGILASIASPLADGGVSIFAISTYNTDYVLVQNQRFTKACRLLREVGFIVRRQGRKGVQSAIGECERHEKRS